MDNKKHLSEKMRDNDAQPVSIYTMKKWPPISELPDDKNLWCVFCHWHQLDSIPVTIETDVCTIGDAKSFREWEIKNSYTHFMIIEPPVEAGKK